ncbi:unnamed protein product (macronuclear) [Paramecium tetraurelia]|uniref:Transmembrane protein n=1 Tax=Paramecium tetraurelia TaxID=5888 RepID=A0E4V2_PARTE|nr:uncharacterized protein GSPATT00023495001 [Paramecium tetraurelia]CAK90319.1 unnamed protein product [Paramecium tetraurelia]|eukprot:XP_001457716.1 hypothetical protein (macronuclear) [Paramecium tetraurelia strain d4-2]
MPQMQSKIMLRQMCKTSKLLWEQTLILQTLEVLQTLIIEYQIQILYLIVSQIYKYRGLRKIYKGTQQIIVKNIVIFSVSFQEQKYRICVPISQATSQSNCCSTIKIVGIVASMPLTFMRRKCKQQLTIVTTRLINDLQRQLEKEGLFWCYRVQIKVYEECCCCSFGREFIEIQRILVVYLQKVRTLRNSIFQQQYVDRVQQYQLF